MNATSASPYEALTKSPVNREEFLLRFGNGKLIIIRHAEARKTHPSKKQNDGSRQLTDKGVAQSRVHLERFSEIDFTLVASSPYTRVITTLNETTGYAYEGQIRKLAALAPSDEKDDLLNVLFHRLGYKALLEGDGKSGYLDQENYNERKAVEEFGHCTLECILIALPEIKAHRALIGTHAVALPAIIWSICQTLGPDTEGCAELEAMALALNTAEAQAIEMNFETDGTVTFEVLSAIPKE